MIVPLQLVFQGGRTETIFVDIDEDEETIDIVLGQEPDDVIFNPDHAILAYGDIPLTNPVN